MIKWFVSGVLIMFLTGSALGAVPRAGKGKRAGIAPAAVSTQGEAPEASTGARTAPANEVIPANATVDDIKRTVQGLMQTGKCEEAFYTCAAAVKANPSYAASLKDIAADAMKQTVDHARDSLGTGKAWQAWPYIHRLWPGLVDPSCAVLFPSQAEYQRTLLETYPLVFDCTYNLAVFYKNRSDVRNGLIYVNYCIGYRPNDPDPRAVQLRDELMAMPGAAQPKTSKGAPKSENAQSEIVQMATEGTIRAAASPLPVTAGIEIRLTTPDGDGFAHSDGGFQPDVRIGGVTCNTLLCFPNVAIPKGAKIKHATLRGYWAKFTDWGKPPFQANIFGEAADKIELANAQATLPQMRIKTTQQVQWEIPAPVEGWYESPDISSLIEAAINRPSYQPGSTLSLIMSGGKGTSDFISYEQDPQRAFRLVVEF